MDFSKAKIQIDDMKSRIDQERTRIAQALKALKDAQAVLSGFSAQYAEMIAAVGAWDAKEPFAQPKAELAEYLKEVTALTAEAASKQSAVEAIG